MPPITGAWEAALRPEFRKPYYRTLFETVGREYRTAVVYPPADEIFNAFHFTPLEKVKVVILGQDPYHEPGQAEGLCFSVKPGVQIPPSLVNIYQELHDDLGCTIPNHGSLVKWAEQGVLLLNTVLTVRAHQANSHRDIGWEQFTDAAIRVLAEQDQPIDCGIDFYATQTMIAPDGRRIMTAWMQNWDTVSFVGETLPWCGQMVTPRELHVKDGHLIQQPVREIEALRRETVHYEKQRIRERTTLEGVSGRTAELLIEIEPAEEGSFSSFEIRLAEKDKTYTSLVFDPLHSLFSFNRSFSGSVRNVAHERRCRIPDRNGHLSLRILLDRFSCEVFLNGGEQAVSHVLYTDADAEGISFSAEGCADLTITCFRLSR